MLAERSTSTAQEHGSCAPRDCGQGMTKPLRIYSGRRFFLLTAAPIFCAAVAFCLGAYLFLQWSVRAVDAAAIARQEERVEMVMGRLRTEIARDQESVTAWDDAVSAVRDPAQEGWVDLNLGVWLHDYFSHDAAYILDARDQPVYASVDGRKIAPAHYDQIRDAAQPMLARLRERLHRDDHGGTDDHMLGPGVSDFGFDHGHPALISLKPIISYTGKIFQVPGTEYVHIAVRRLDGDFFPRLAALYRVDNLAYAPRRAVLPGFESLPIRTRAGATIGYVIWRPYRPGTEVFQSIAPAIGGILAALLAALGAGLRLWHGRNLSSRIQEERIHHLVHHDALTDLPNRAEFHHLLDQVLADPTGREGAVLYLDIDHLKAFNASRGHAAGDAVVRETGRRIAEVAAGRALACRLDGDEFGVIATGVDEAGTQALCEEILAAVRVPIAIANDPVFIGISIGVARFPEHGVESSELFRKADVALHQAKSDGRGHAAEFNAKLDTMLIERAEIENDLRIALRDFTGISVHYQPIFRASDRTLVAAEALARWQHPTRGWISPAQFIPIAESSNLIKRLGAHVLRVSCRAAAEWKIGCIAVNVSVIQLRDPAFVATVRAALDDEGLPPERLELEITESTWVEDGGQCAINLRELRELGVRIALDDFGTGFSTFGRLHEAETVDRIKIDQSFVMGSGQAKGDKAIVRAIVDLARTKGIATTAEGVETLESAEFLTRIGCDELQGFLFARPLPYDEATALIRDLGYETPMLAG
jgi:diguanylate cyclase (GGDEF)-like protein